MFEPRCISPEDRLNTRQRVVVVAMNLLLLAELTWAMYHGQHSQNLTAVFLRTFVPLAAGTIVAARLLIRRLDSRKAAKEIIS